ncbi:hypothetical protein [Lacisediminimonas profundi]|uniref:hypothetical protein n=1 Tax=Lacisediminimonas profundi TaxID=2603856 RepID=UPI00124B1779|nr:hypothetical protein [Lacisediminimonas profundi]
MRHRETALALLIVAAMAACGGGDSGAILTLSPPGSPGPSGMPPAPSAVTISSFAAPAGSARLAGTTVLTIEGENIGNAELVPGASLTPQLGRFSVAADGRSASLEFDTTTVPNGPLTLRILAWNLPAGSTGAGEVLVMAPRTWLFANEPPPAGTDAGRAARCQNMGYPYTAPDDIDPVVCITARPTATPVEQCVSFGTGYGSPEDLLEVLRNGARISKLYCIPGANNDVLNPGCVCLS